MTLITQVWRNNFGLLVGDGRTNSNGEVINDNLRKIYVKENKNKALKESEISNSFKNYLETNLNIKITENL